MNATVGLGWTRSVALLLRWHAYRLRRLLPLMLVVQALLATGVVLGFGLLMPEIDGTTALFLATGAPTTGLITVGLVLVPQAVAQTKLDGSFEFTRSLPAPRSALLVSDLVIWTSTTLPGLAAALLVAGWRFDLDYSVSITVVPAILLVAATSVSVGYAFAYALPPAAATLIAQVLVFVTLLFSPVTFPADRLPSWLAEIHAWLPVQAMADLVRDALSDVDLSDPVRTWGLVVAWFTVALAAAGRILTRSG